MDIIINMFLLSFDHWHFPYSIWSNQIVVDMIYLFHPKSIYQVLNSNVLSYECFYVNIFFHPSVPNIIRPFENFAICWQFSFLFSFCTCLICFSNSFVTKIPEPMVVIKYKNLFLLSMASMLIKSLTFIWFLLLTYV